MSLNILNELQSPLEQEILLQEKKYKEALKADAEFDVLKAIHQKIKKLKANLERKV